MVTVLQTAEVQTTGEPWRLGHRAALDGVRGVAILLVVAAHAVPQWFPSSGAAGVAVFFALSGFLITSLLLEEVDDRFRIRLGRFYARRAARLFPALAVFVLVMLVLQVFVAKNFGSPSDLVPVALYVGNWVPALGGTLGGLDHTWSLAVEEQFYILFPLLLVALVGRVSRRAMLIIVAGGAAVSLALRFGLLAAGATVDRVYRGTDTAACLLLFGCVAAIAVHEWAPRVQRPRLALASLTAAAALGIVGPTIGGEVTVPVLAALLAVLAIVSVIATEHEGLLAHPVLVLIGQRSYGLYLWHFPLMMIVGEALEIGGGMPRYVTALPLLAIAWGLTVLSWRFVEQPAQTWVRARLRHSAVGVGGEPVDDGVAVVRAQLVIEEKDAGVGDVGASRSL